MAWTFVTTWQALGTNFPTLVDMPTTSSCGCVITNLNDLTWANLNRSQWGALSSLCSDTVTTTWVCTQFEEGHHN